MQIHNVVQGTPEWHALRADCFASSEAPVMMGCSSKMTRDELLYVKATGDEKKFPSYVEDVIFPRGHEYEAMARPIVEKNLNEELFPATATSDEYPWMLSSFDGVTMMEDVIFEHKQWNAALAALVVQSNEIGECQLTGEHFWQLEQQLAVSGAEKAIFVVSDGTEENMVSMEYFPVPGRKEQLIAGWEQFKKDLESYQPQESKAIPSANVISDLPVVTYRMNGMAVSSDFDKFKERASILIDRAKKPMVVDQDFADGKELVKIFGNAEEMLKHIADRVIAEVADIASFRQEILDKCEEIRRSRIDLDKRYENELKSRKAAIQGVAKQQIMEFASNLESGLNGIRLQKIDDGIVSATKGKRTLDTFQSSANDAVASAKIAYRQQAELIQANLRALDENAGEYRFLFADLQSIAFKSSDDFSNLVNTRISQHKAAEAAKLEAERERIRKEAESSHEVPPESIASIAKTEPVRMTTGFGGASKTQSRITVTISSELVKRLQNLASIECPLQKLAIECLEDMGLEVPEMA